MTRIALYARISTKDKNQDTENQLLQLRQYCANQPGWTVIDEYIDQKTGRTADRDAFQRLFQDAYQKKFDLCFFWALDRFSREGAAETLRHLQKLTSYGILWKSYTEPYIDSAGMFSDVIVSLLATVAKQESVRRSERASASYSKLVLQGRTDHLGRKRLVVDRSKIVEMHACGMTVRAVAEKFGIARIGAPDHTDRGGSQPLSVFVIVVCVPLLVYWLVQVWKLVRSRQTGRPYKPWAGPWTWTVCCACG